MTKILFSITLLLCTVQSFLFASPKYKLIDLGNPDIKSQVLVGSRATSINNHGQVCGVYSGGVFFWDPNFGFQDIGVKNISGDPKINDHGVIVGVYNHYDSQQVFKSSIFRWERKSGLSDINLLPGRYQILDFNNLNNILYVSFDEKNVASLYLDFEPLGSLFSTKNAWCAASINDNSEMFGFGEVTNGIALRNFDSKMAHLEDVFLFKGNPYNLAGLNNANTAAGCFDIHGHLYGFVWSKNKGLEILENFHPSCLNDNEQIVSDGFFGGNRPLILDNGEEIDINENLGLEFDLSTPWAAVTKIYDINNRGQMVGEGILFGNAYPRAVLLTPISNQKE